MENPNRKDGNLNVSVVRSEAELGQKKERFRNYRSSTLVDSRSFDSVFARIYANETHAGEVLFKVGLVRLYTMSNGSGEAFSFEKRDLSGAIKALKWAQSWLWKAERHSHRFSVIR
jgi:hypothetical protein